MTRVITVSQMQGVKRAPRHEIPREGSALRELYDRLRRGEVIVTTAFPRGVVENLRNTYGMEIAKAFKGQPGLILKGEWIGPYFVSLEQILQEDQT